MIQEELKERIAKEIFEIVHPDGFFGYQWDELKETEYKEMIKEYEGNADQILKILTRANCAVIKEKQADYLPSVKDVNYPYVRITEQERMLKVGFVQVERIL